MKSNKFSGTVDLYIERDEKEIQVFVEFTYWPEEPMVQYFPDGSGYPGSPEEFEILSVTDKDGAEYYLDERETEQVGEKILAQYPDDQDE